jgi:hypothetical protein
VLAVVQVQMTSCVSSSQATLYFAEEQNQLHHLLTAESMGSDKPWWDRYLARYAAAYCQTCQTCTGVCF